MTMDQYDDRALGDWCSPGPMYDINIEDIDFGNQPANPLSPSIQRHSEQAERCRTPVSDLKTTYVERNAEWTIPSSSGIADYSAGIFDDIEARPDIIIVNSTKAPATVDLNPTTNPTNATTVLSATARPTIATSPIPTPRHPPRPLPTTDSTSTTSLLQFLTAVKSATVTLTALDTTTIYSTISSLESQLAAAKSANLFTSVHAIDIEILKTRACEAQLMEAEWHQKYDEVKAVVQESRQDVLEMKTMLGKKESELLEVRKHLAGVLLADRQVDARAELKDQTITRLTRRAEKAEDEIRKLRAQLHRPDATGTSRNRSASPPCAIRGGLETGPQQGNSRREEPQQSPMQQEELPNPMAGLEDDLPRPYQLYYAAHERQQAARQQAEARRPASDHSIQAPQNTPHQGTPRRHQEGYSPNIYSHGGSYGGTGSYRGGRGRGWRGTQDGRAGGPYGGGRPYDEMVQDAGGDYRRENVDAYGDFQHARGAGLWGRARFGHRGDNNEHADGSGFGRGDSRQC